MKNDLLIYSGANINNKKIIMYEVRVQVTSENDLCSTNFYIHGNQCFAPDMKTETHFLVPILNILFFYSPL